MALLIFYLALALVVSFLCSIMEAVLLSVSPSFVAARAQEGHRSAEALRRLKADIDRPLAAILSLNTVAHTVGAAGAGAQAAVVFGDAYVAAASAVLTLLILIISEIIPKTLGAVYWRSLSGVVARLLPPIIWLTYPLVLLSQGLSRLITPSEKEASVSREEITAMAELGTQEGVFEEDESRILRNLFRFRSLRVADVMTPRTVILALPETTTVAEVVAREDILRFSRLPIYGANRDDMTGYVLKDQVLLRAAQGHESLALRALRRPLVVVPEGLPLPKLFERLLDASEHLALVVDEYGGTAGLVTMEDVVETLLGMEIVDEADSVGDMQELARAQWRRRAARLGLVPLPLGEPGSEAAEAEAEAVARLGITGGQPPSKPRQDAGDA